MKRSRTIGCEIEEKAHQQYRNGDRSKQLHSSAYPALSSKSYGAKQYSTVLPSGLLGDPHFPFGLRI
jgi:hypothetical protein